MTIDSSSKLYVSDILLIKLNAAAHAECDPPIITIGWAAVIVGSEEDDDDDAISLPGNGVANLCSIRSVMNKKYSEKNKYTRQSEKDKK